MLGKKDIAHTMTGVSEVIHMELQIDNDWYHKLMNFHPHQTEEIIGIITALRAAGRFKEEINEEKIKTNRNYFRKIQWQGLGMIARHMELLRKELLKENIKETNLGEKNIDKE